MKFKRLKQSVRKYCSQERSFTNKSSLPLAANILAVYKSGTGTRGRGHRDACVGTWDLGTQDEGLEDIKYGARERVGRGGGDVKIRDAGDAGCEELLQKSEVNVSLFS